MQTLYKLASVRFSLNEHACVCVCVCVCANGSDTAKVTIPSPKKNWRPKKTDISENARLDREYHAECNHLSSAHVHLILVIFLKKNWRK